MNKAKQFFLYIYRIIFIASMYVLYIPVHTQRDTKNTNDLIMLHLTHITTTNFLSECKDIYNIISNKTDCLAIYYHKIYLYIFR